MSEQAVKGSAKITCIYYENGNNIQNLLAESFALFVEKEAIQSYNNLTPLTEAELPTAERTLLQECNNEQNGWLPIGGTICTQE